MTAFWVYAALLTAVALAILIAPLLRSRSGAGAAVSRDASNLAVFRDQLAELDADLAAGNLERGQWESARADLERGLLEDTSGEAAAVAPVARAKGVALALLALVPLVAVMMYLVLGSPRALNPARASAAQQSPHELSQEQIEAMVAKLASRLQSNPDDAEGWVMLARTYSAMSRFDQAASAYAKATNLVPKDAQLLADYADSLAMTQGQSLKGEPEALIRRALEADGNNLKALALAGSVEFEKQDFAKAAEYWRRILPLLPPDSKMQDSVRASIKEAEGKQGGAGAAVAATTEAAPGGKAPAATKKAAGGGARLSGIVKLAPALAARAAPEDTVFVLARPAQGSRMPLAAVRVKVKDLPLEFAFDDTMAMSPAAKLSDFSEVVVAARVSKSGNVMPQSGDLEGVSKPVSPRSSGMNVEIATEIK